MSCIPDPNANAADTQTINAALAAVRARIVANQAQLPPDKYQMLLDLLDPTKPPQWTIYIVAGLARGVTPLDGETLHTARAPYPARSILLRPQPMLGRREAVLLHELVHATGEGEIDAEVIEHLVYPESATAPEIEDTGTVPGPGGPGKSGDFGREFDGVSGFPAPTTPGAIPDKHYEWDPNTGEVWETEPDPQQPGKRTRKRLVIPLPGGSPWTRPPQQPQQNGSVVIGSYIFLPHKLALHQKTSTGGVGKQLKVPAWFIIELFNTLVAAHTKWADQQGLTPHQHCDWAPLVKQSPTPPQD